MSKERLPIVEMSENFEVNLEKYASQIRERLGAAMAGLVSDIDPSEKVGVALSGGIDSTIVSHLLQEYRNHNNIAFSLHVQGYEGEERDLDMAKQAATSLNLDHKIITVSPEQVIRSVGPVIKLITPSGRKVHDFNVYSGVVTYLLGREMKKAGVKKCFSGEGLDELFGSYGPSGSFQFSHDEMTTVQMRKKLFDNLTEGGYLDRTTKTLKEYGIDARSPYMDRNFADFMLTIPSEFFNQKYWKLPLIKAFENELPLSLRDNIVRPKVRAQVGTGVFEVLQKAGFDQKKLEVMKTG